MRIKYIVLLLLLPLTYSCHTNNDNKQSKTPKDGILYFTDEIPEAKKIGFYNFNPDSSILSRIAPAPQELLDLVDQADLMKEYSVNLKNSELTQAEKGILLDAFEYLPLFMQKLIQERVVLFSFVDNYPGGGGVDYIFDEWGNEYYVILINKVYLQLSLSEIMFYNNYIYFKPVENVYVTFDFNKDYSSILWLLLHETAHCLDYTYNITHTDPWDSKVIKQGKKKPDINTDFTKKIWETQSIVKEPFKFAYLDRLNQNYKVSTDAEIFSVEKINAFYTDLLQTPFVTPYAAFNSLDDFAEFFSFYHLTQHLGCKYIINIKQNNKILNSYEPMKSPEVQKRFPDMQIFYKDYSQEEYQIKFGI